MREKPHSATPRPQIDKPLACFNGCQPAAVQLDNVAWSPYKKAPLLAPISLSIKAGEFVAVVGPNGSGKTSLLRCMYRVNKPTAGRVLIDGADIWTVSARHCAQRIATVLQDTGSEFGLSVFEMVEIGLTPTTNKWKRTEADIDMVNAMLELLNVSHLAGQSFRSLSGGERQRVLIARALVQRPDILILDEPTNHLDIHHQLELLELLSTLPCTLVVSLHDLSLAATYADRVLVMKDGQMQNYSEPDNVFTQEQIRKVFEVETVIDEHPITKRPRLSFYLDKHRTNNDL